MRTHLRSTLNPLALLVLAAGAATALADPDAGVGRVLYTFPKERTVAGTEAVSYAARAARGNWVLKGEDPVEFQGSPFSFLLSHEDDFTMTAFSDGARASVVTKLTAGVLYERSQTWAQFGLPGAHGSRRPDMDVGNVGTLGKTDSPTAEQTRARAFAIQDMINLGGESIGTLGGAAAGLGKPGTDMRKQELYFPRTSGTTAFNPTTKKIGVLAHDAVDADVLLHEYGHSIADKFGFDDPTVNGDHRAGAECGSEKLAWGEGVATWLGVFTQNISPAKATYSTMKHFGDTFYTDTEDADVHYDLEGNKLGKLAATAAVNSKGFKDELSVSRFMWDLYDDTPNEILDDNLKAAKGFKDNVAFGKERMWKLLTKPPSGAGPQTVKSFIQEVGADIRGDAGLGFWAKVSQMLDVGALLSDHNLAPAPKAAAAPAPGPGGKDIGGLTLHWDRADDIMTTIDSKSPDGDIEGGVPSSDGFDNFNWFRLVFLDDTQQQVAGMTDWTSAASLLEPGSDRAWAMDLSPSLIAQLLAGQDYRWLNWFIQTESSEFLSPSQLPSDVLMASVWSAHDLVAVPTPGAGLLMITGLGLISSRRKRA